MKTFFMISMLLSASTSIKLDAQIFVTRSTAENIIIMITPLSVSIIVFSPILFHY